MGHKNHILHEVNIQFARSVKFCVGVYYLIVLVMLCAHACHVHVYYMENLCISLVCMRPVPQCT